MHFLWKPTFENEDGPYLEQDSLYTHVLYKTYSGPCDLPFAEFWNQYSMPSRFESTARDFPRKSAQYLQCLSQIANAYKSDNILLTMGDDFAYYFAEETYEYLEKFAKQMKEDSNGKYELVYSSVEKYLEDVLEEVETKSFVLKEF